MDNKVLQKLTEEQKHKVLYVLNDFFSEYFSEDSDESKEVTEYDVLMKKKEEEFKLHLLEDNEPGEIDSLIDMCEQYIKEKENPQKTTIGADFGFILLYDMWLNKSAVWPVQHNPEWEEWKKLKNIKVNKNQK
jgi:hypothetical protein